MTKKSPISKNKKYSCEDCYYYTNSIKDYNKHLLTAKHKRITNDYTKIPSKYICDFCDKSYVHRQNLYRHQKTCKAFQKAKEEHNNNQIQDIDNNSGEITELLKSILQENKLLREKISTLELNNTTINNTNNGTINKNKYTINMFLNEKCKDAMNIDEFVEKLKLTLDDLHYTKDNGYTKGISNIFIKSLTNMDLTKRPIHCTDQKRLQFYVKDEDKWDKDKDNTKIDNSICKVAQRHVQTIQEWVAANPDFAESDKKMDEYLKLLHSIMKPNDKKNLKDIKKNVGENIKLEKEEYSSS